MKKVTVYNCAIPQHYAFCNLHYRSIMRKCPIEIVTSLKGKPVDTRDCVTALQQGAADVASFPWLEGHAEELPEGAFRSTELFKDPLSLLLPRNKTYEEFLRGKGVKEGEQLTSGQLLDLLEKCAETQKLLLREEASGTRQQIEQILNCSVDENGRLHGTQVDSEYDSTIHIYCEILSSARLEEKPFLIGFVSKKIQVLASAPHEDTDRIFFLDLEKGEREFRVVYRRDQRDADRAAILMAEMARRIEVPAAEPLETPAVQPVEMRAGRRVCCPLWGILVLVAICAGVGFSASMIVGCVKTLWPAVTVPLFLVSGIASGWYLVDKFRCRKR